ANKYLLIIISVYYTTLNTDTNYQFIGLLLFSIKYKGVSNICLRFVSIEFNFFSTVFCSLLVNLILLTSSSALNNSFVSIYKSTSENLIFKFLGFVFIAAFVNLIASSYLSNFLSTSILKFKQRPSFGKRSAARSDKESAHFNLF